MSAFAQTALGRHVLADLHGVDEHLLNDTASIEAVLNRAALTAGATPILSKFHHFGEGQGVTGVLLLRESHISIHTWPEFGFAAVDAFMCGSARPDLAINIVQMALRPERCEIRQIERGEHVFASADMVKTA